MSETAPSVQQLFDLSGRVALITGGARGIGREIAQGFLEVGAKVAFTSRQLELARASADDLAKKTGGDVFAAELDVRDEQVVAKVFEKVAQRFGRLDVLVNNAGGASPAETYDLWDRKLDDWRRVSLDDAAEERIRHQHRQHGRPGRSRPADVRRLRMGPTG